MINRYSWHYWFHLSWYKYLFGKPHRKGYCGFFKRAICRIKGHTPAKYYYDDFCIICGDDIL